MINRDPYSDRSWASIAGTALLGVSTIWLSYLVHCYGVNGALRYIWEGDPNPENIREQMEKLSAAEKGIKKQIKTISTLEEGLQRARLDTIDDSDPSSLLKLWRRNLPANLQDLRMRLALLSTDVDKVASKVDQVLPPQEDGEEVRKRKKALSKRIVETMERADALIDFFKSAAPS